MSLRKRGFTLVEILIGLAVTSVALVAIFGFVLVVLKVWTEFSGMQRREQENREMVAHRFLTHEIGSTIMGLNRMDGSGEVSFRKLNGSIAVEGSNDGYFYWVSKNPQPFLREVKENQSRDGATECWLKWEGTSATLRAAAIPGELRLYYRSLSAGQAPDHSGGAGEAKDFVVLLKNCVGLNFGYVDKDFSASSNGKEWRIQYYSTPRFPHFNGIPDLPELIQILTPQ
jgi:prepilin-type N-terminal cleavage/methylation domain-containing protein